MSLQTGEVVKVIVKRSPYSGATGRVERLTRSGKSVWVTFEKNNRTETARFLVSSVQKTSEVARRKSKRTAEDAIIELADELTRLVRLVSEHVEARVGTDE